MSGHRVLDLVWLIPALPAFGAVALLLFGKRIGEPAAGWLATSTMGLSFICSIVAFAVLVGRHADQREQVRTLWTWFESGSFVVKMGFLVDPLSVTMILFVLPPLFIVLIGPTVIHVVTEVIPMLEHR